MPEEIIYPAETTYWIAKDTEGNIVHVGVVQPDQALSTSQPLLITYTKEIDQIKEIQDFLGQPQPAYNYKYDEVNRTWEFREDAVIYLPVSIAMASELNSALYKCIDPNGTGNYAVEIPHLGWPGYVLYQLNKTDKIPVDLAVDPTPLQNALAIAVAHNGISQEEADQIVSNVQANAGNIVNLIDFIPDSWQPYILNRQQAELLRYI